MARPPAMQQVDYFPHMTKHGKTMYIIEQRYENNGYAFWFKLLEILGGSPGHYIDTTQPDSWEFLQARTRCSEQLCTEILNLLARLDAIDQDLWNRDRVIWSQNLVDNLQHLYSKRKAGIPQKPGFRAGNPPSTPVPTAGIPQRIGEDRRGEREKGALAVSEAKTSNPESNGQSDPLTPPEDQPETYAMAEHAWQSLLALFPPRNGKLHDLEECKLKFLSMPADWNEIIRCGKNYAASREVADGAVMNLMTFLSRRKFSNWLEPEQPLGGDDHMARSAKEELWRALRNENNRGLPAISDDARKLFYRVAHAFGINWAEMQLRALAGERILDAAPVPQSTSPPVRDVKCAAAGDDL